jgi:uncharacterized protein YukE
VMTTLSQLQGTLDDEGPCWGSDETGRTFESAYGPAVTTMQDGLTELGRAVDSIAQALSVVADQAEAVDGRTATRLAG